MNALLQWAAVALILATAIAWIIRRLRKKPSSPCDSCGKDCPINPNPDAKKQAKHDTQSI